MPQELSKSNQPSLLQKIFGYGQMSPEIEEGIRIAKSENPNMPTPTRMGLLAKMFTPSNALAATYPFRNISMNENMLKGHTPQEVADTLAHENTHVQQMRNDGVLGQIYRGYQESQTPYWEKPSEVEAFRSTANRQKARGATVEPILSVTGGYYSPQDVNLPLPGSPDFNRALKMQAVNTMNYTVLNPKTGQYEKVKK